MEKISSKLLQPTHEDPEMPCQGLKSWKAITMPGIGAYLNTSATSTAGSSMRCSLHVVANHLFAALVPGLGLGAASAAISVPGFIWVSS
ncbi:hypothetical protein D3C75_1150910 [compost metagenome]